MRCIHTVSFLLAGIMPFLSAVQSGHVPSPSEAPGHELQRREPAQSTVGPDDPVITINGFCGDPLVQGSVCKTVVSRAQFDKLAEALQPEMPIPLRLKVASAYARNMRMATTAEARGLDKMEAFEEEMRFARLQLLAQDLDRVLRAEAENISDDDIKKYYEKNRYSFEQATLARVFVPHSSHPEPGVTEAHLKTSAEFMSKLATDLRARAVRGDDMNKLQIEAYAQAGIERTKADTKLENVRRATLPPQHESVMDLKPGEVSEILSDPEGAHFIYKMIEKRTLTLEQAGPEIRSAISTDRYRVSTKAFQGDVTFSDAYFNPPAKAGKPAMRGHKTEIR